MWRMISRLATTTLTATLALAGFATNEAGASAVQSYSYSTSGSIAGPSSSGPISFFGIGSQSFTTPGSFSLGQFDAANILPSSASLTYNSTPFTINLNVPGGSGGTYTYQISGELNGSISGSGVSNMLATVSSITGIPQSDSGTMTTPPFPVSDIHIDYPQGINAPNGHSDGLTYLYAQVSPQLLAPVAAPEPATIAVLGAGVVALGVRRISRSKRRDV